MNQDMAIEKILSAMPRAAMQQVLLECFREGDGGRIHAHKRRMAPPAVAQGARRGVQPCDSGSGGDLPQARDPAGPT